MKMKLAAVATVAVMLLWSLPAHASTVSIGLALNGGPITTVAGPDSTGSLNFAEPLGTFLVNAVLLQGNPPLANPEVLDSSSININGFGPAAAEVDVWVTSQGNTPVGPALITGLTSNALSAGWSVEMKTWIGPDDTQFGTGTLIADGLFTAPGLSTSEQTAFPPLTDPYSITAEYIIKAPGAGSSDSTIKVSAPEPSSLLLLGAGLLGLGFSLRRKHR